MWFCLAQIKVKNKPALIKEHLWWGIMSANLIETYTFISSKEVITTGGMIVQNKREEQNKYSIYTGNTLIYILQTLGREICGKHN